MHKDCTHPSMSMLEVSCCIQLACSGRTSHKSSSLSKDKVQPVALPTSALRMYVVNFLTNTLHLDLCFDVSDSGVRWVFRTSCETLAELHQLPSFRVALSGTQLRNCLFLAVPATSLNTSREDRSHSQAGYWPPPLPTSGAAGPFEVPARRAQQEHVAPWPRSLQTALTNTASV